MGELVVAEQVYKHISLHFRIIITPGECYIEKDFEASSLAQITHRVILYIYNIFVESVSLVCGSVKWRKGGGEGGKGGGRGRWTVKK